MASKALHSQVGVLDVAGLALQEAERTLHHRRLAGEVGGILISESDMGSISCQGGTGRKAE